MNISETIKKNGYYVSDELISENDLDELQSFIGKQIDLYPNKNFRLYDENFSESIIKSENFNDKINKLLSKILAENSIEYQDNNCYKVIRVVAGEQQKKQAYLYHFDAHLITILIPIIIPNNKSKKNGDLVLFPNLRRLHKNLLLNLIQKIFFQNIIVRTLLNFNIVKKFLKHKLLKIEPGNLYVFFGFNSLHGNLEIESSSTRATLLIHAHDVFENSSIVKLNRNQSINKEIKNIKV